MSSTRISTPVRELGTPDPAGFRLLADVGSSYRDGGEERVLEIIDAARDVSSTSDELIVSATTWAERYHLDPSRANVLRALELPADARVLEIGAGCGAITRYLGEACALVDALEPVPARAAAAAARTRDLDDVQVLVGSLADVPAEPAYDVVVVVGVLEYVGAGTVDRAPYREFLDQISERLVDGGTLVLAIENRLGVKYLVGSPEDHTGRVFDSVEGYPVGGKARTFTRLELETLMRGSGLEPQTLVAFPDYKLTRAVMGEMPAGAESLLYRIPRLPSPDWTKPRPRLADEGRVWRSLVEGGLAADFGNSLVVLAGKGGPAQGFWPADRLAAFYSRDRRPALGTETLVEHHGGSVRFVRRGLVEGPHVVGSMHLIESVADYAPGRDLLEVLAEGGLPAAAPLVADWLRLLRAAADTDEHVAMDLVPHNLVVDDDGTVHVIDIELVDDRLGPDAVIRRGVYWLAERVTRMAPPARWAPHTTVAEVMIALGTQAGLPGDGSWIEQAVAEEAEVAMTVRPGPPTGLTMQQWREKLESGFRAIPARTLTGLAVGERLPETLKRTQASLKQTRADAARTDARLAKVTADLAKARAELKAARAHTLEGRARRLGGTVLPRGTRRRAVAARAAKQAKKLR